jgi:hypothetical protein
MTTSWNSGRHGSRRLLVFFIAILVPVAAVPARTLRVGPGERLTLPSEAAAKARTGDVIEIAAGLYAGDAAVWRASRLTLRGIGGRAHLRADGHDAEGKAIWVVKGDDTLIENIEFSGAAVSDRNGAGIRAEGRNLVIRNCFFHDNENGVLGGVGDVLIEGTEFAHNGAGDGYTHNIYIGARTDRFTLRASYSHHARVGHNVKSRARENHIVYNRIMDEGDGESSYSIDLPNGGRTFVVGNVIQQGPAARNDAILMYGAEGIAADRDADLLVVNNTFVNDFDRGRFVVVSEMARRARLINNLVAGPGTFASGPVDETNNVVTREARFVDREHYDYRLRPDSPAVNAGTDPGMADAVPLLPAAQYRHPTGEVPRRIVGAPDAGAFELESAVTN